jgi:post-segregation antitoxin (ccd killing protein)
MYPLSTPFLLTKPGERMVMYLCARDIDVSSFYTFSIDQARRENGHVRWQKEETSISLAHKYMTILSPGLVNRKCVEREKIDISSTQIHDHSLSWLGQ